MDTHSGVAAPYHSNPTIRNVHGPAPLHGSADHGALLNHFTGMTLGGLGMPNNAAPIPMGPGHTFVLGSDGQLVLAPMPSAQHMGLGNSENPYQSFSTPPGGYGAPYVGLPIPLMPFTPGRSNNVTHPRLDRGHSDVPGLDNRRGSYSTTESTPATPFYGAFSHRENAPRVANLDRSAYTTPSPQQMGHSALHADSTKPAPAMVSDRVLDELLTKDPAIPKAVPAVFTPPGQMKSLEQSLDNRISGNRNVYIRGLHPTTDDELLYHFASRFGAVETSKAIIDTATGACKGYVSFWLF